MSGGAWVSLRCKSNQKSRRMETCPERAPPKSELMALEINPKLGELMFMLGSLRLVWLRTLVKVPSARSLSRSVMEKVLLRPAERLTVPGPTTEPTWAFPKRPMGLGTGPEPLPVVQAVPGCHAG